ncbi:MAG: 1-deoxy-D-xylulose-5-phosphate synthase, partial [Dehalococcoidales bacterium]|nr:1-deoxy-D-xylulose-5-phosphate synthase [Dehalococcoidales bacterium]
PKDEDELQHLLYTAVNSGKVMAVRYPRGTGAGVPLSETLRTIPIGKGEILREGGDAAILATGISVQASLAAADILSEKGIAVTVVNARFVKPLDEELILDTARRVKTIITVEENTVKGGFGTCVLDLLQEKGVCDVSVRCLGVPDIFVEHGTQEIIRKKYGLDAGGIADTVTAMLAAADTAVRVTDG